MKFAEIRKQLDGQRMNLISEDGKLKIIDRDRPAKNKDGSWPTKTVFFVGKNLSEINDYLEGK